MKISCAEFVTSAVRKSDYPAGELPEVALAGRSNVGKSSLLNRLAVRKSLARTSKTPAVPLINFFLINGVFRLVDLPGYGYAKVSAGEEKLAEDGGGLFVNEENLRGVVLLVDSRHPPTSQDADVRLVEAPGDTGGRGCHQGGQAIPLQIAAFPPKVVRETLALAEETLVPFSAETGQGREELLEVIGQWTGIPQ